MPGKKQDWQQRGGHSGTTAWSEAKWNKCYFANIQSKFLEINRDPWIIPVWTRVVISWSRENPISSRICSRVCVCVKPSPLEITQDIMKSSAVQNQHKYKVLLGLTLHTPTNTLLMIERQGFPRGSKEHTLNFKHPCSLWYLRGHWASTACSACYSGTVGCAVRRMMGLRSSYKTLQVSETFKPPLKTHNPNPL